MAIIITGNGRCGSSLTMQMLAAAGLPVVGDPPYFEDVKSSISRFNPKWLEDLPGGSCVKVLGLHQVKVRGKHKIIFLTRNPSAQAASQNKFQNIVIKREVAGHDAMKKQVKRQNRKCLEACHRITKDVLQIKFEDLIEIPMITIGRICNFLELKPLNEYGPKMINVIRPRGIECLPDMELERMNQ